MNSKGILPGPQAKKEMVLPFDFKGKNTKNSQSEFKNILNKNIDNEKKQPVFQSVKAKEQSKRKDSPVITDGDKKIDDKTDKTDKNTELLEAIVNLMDLLNSANLRIELDEKTKGQLEDIKQALMKLSNAENIDGKLSMDKEILNKLEALEKNLNWIKATIIPSEYSIKEELHAIKEALASIQKELADQNNQNATKEKNMVRSDSLGTLNEGKAQEVPGKESPVEVKTDHSTQLDPEKKKQDHENKGQGDASKAILSQGKEKNISTSNIPEEGIHNDKITFQGTKPISFVEGENKQSLPVQKQLFNSILEQVEKGHIHVREQDSEMQLQLKPDNLGSLSLKIAIEKGIVVAKIIAENQVVKETLESNFNLLKDALNDKGFAIQELSVSIGQDSSFKKRQAFEQFKKLKGGRMIKDLDFNMNTSSLNTVENQSSVLNSNIDFFA